MNLRIVLPDAFFADEKREILVDSAKKKVWAILLDLLSEFHRVCKENNIQYFLDSGTLLGAVRHGGFIPWDDDVDVVMLRKDYKRLCEIAQSKFEPPYFFQTNSTDPGSARGHAQLRNSETTGMLKAEIRGGRPLYSFNQGLFVDIFALDAVPDDFQECIAFRKRLARLKKKIATLRFAMYASQSMSWSFMHPRLLYIKIKGCMLRLFEKLTGYNALTHLYNAMERYAQKYNDTGAKRVGNISLNPLRREEQLFDRRYFDETAQYMFEGFQFSGPKDYNAILTGHYGDWHKHVVGGDAHGGILIDVERPYTFYLEKGSAR